MIVLYRPLCLKVRKTEIITHPTPKSIVCSISLHYDVYAGSKSINPPGSTRPVTCCISGATIISDIIRNLSLLMWKTWVFLDHSRGLRYQKNWWCFIELDHSQYRSLWNTVSCLLIMSNFILAPTLIIARLQSFPTFYYFSAVHSILSSRDASWTTRMLSELGLLFQTV